jgi:hypothetical protein
MRFRLMMSRAVDGCITAKRLIALYAVFCLGILLSSRVVHHDRAGHRA